MSTALVILNYNDAPTALEAAERAIGYACIDHIVIVDNASTDGSAEQLKSALDEHGLSKAGIDIIRTRRNGGYGYGNNHGVRYAVRRFGAGHVLIANPDSVFDEQLVLDMLKVFQDNPDAAAVGAVMRLSGRRRGRDHITWQEYKRSGWIKRGFVKELIASGPVLKRVFDRAVNYSYSYYKGDKDNSTVPAVKVYAVHGSLVMVDTARFLEAGGFDEEIFLYQEEYVLGARLEALGYSTYLLRELYTHGGSHSITGSGYGPCERQKLRAQSELIYYGKYLHAGAMSLTTARLLQRVIMLETRMLEKAVRVGTGRRPGAAFARPDEEASVYGQATEVKEEFGPLVTVIIPAYNSESTIERAVRSVLNQSWRNIEVIVVDDGSSDGTAGIVRRLAGEDGRLRLISKSNHGVSAARNDGIRAASGEWFVTLDSDDYIDSGMAETLVRTVLLDGSDTAICGFRNVYKDGRREEFRAEADYVGSLGAFTDELLAELYDRHMISTHSNKLYNTGLVHGRGIYYNEELAVNEDIDFVLRYLAQCGTVSVVRPAYLNYVQHGTGESLINTFRDNGIQGSVLVMESCMELLDAAGADEDTFRDMSLRMFVHICAYVGLMYRFSGYSDGRKLEELKKLGDTEGFRELMEEVRPDGPKTGLALFLLKHRMYRSYHRLCRVMYR